MTDEPADALELLARMRDGDREATELLIRDHLPGLRGFVRLRFGPLLRSKEASLDIVQSVCREVLEHTERFRYPSADGFRQWLYTTAARKIKNRYEYYVAAKRDARREVGFDEGGVQPEALVAAYASVCTPSCDAAAREEVARIEAAFDQLNEDYREVILLARMVGLSRAEIGARMGRSEAAAKMLLARALARLAELLEG